MKRIGIFGGSFNPIHLGHTALAAYICEQELVDEVWLMVSPQNPLKQNRALLNEAERLAMARLATAPYPMLRACDFEFTLPRPSYTYHTLQALCKAYPDCEFSLIIGEDNWQCFDHWYRGEDIARETPIIVYPRGSESSALSELDGEFSTFKVAFEREQRLLADSAEHSNFNEVNFQLSILKTPPLLPYSSTEVREYIAAGKDFGHMLHPDVTRYIKENNLYITQHDEA